jgi:hypothetical protein
MTIQDYIRQGFSEEKAREMVEMDKQIAALDRRLLELKALASGVPAENVQEYVDAQEALGKAVGSMTGTEMLVKDLRFVCIKAYEGSSGGSEAAIIEGTINNAIAIIESHSQVMAVLEDIAADAATDPRIARILSRLVESESGES